ncbi:hypothetical protein Tsubulata_021618, partial [Turnera subulata]
MANVSSTPHVVVFPFMAQGHTIPLLDISKALANRGLKVTIIATPSNVPFILSKVSAYPVISLSIIPFPKVPYLPEGCENVANLPSEELLFPFVEATENLRKPFEEILREMCNNPNINRTPICVITDMFLYCTVEPCRLFDIPRLVSYGMGALPLVITRSVYLNIPGIGDVSDSETISLSFVSVPFSVVKTDLPRPFWGGRDAVPRVVSEVEKASSSSWGLIVNSFEELEREYVTPLGSLYNTRAWLVGPLLLVNQAHNDEEQQAKSPCEPEEGWLDQRVEEPGSVTYVSFGSQAYLSEEQMEEIAFGLEMAGLPFIWVIRSKTWVPPVGWEDRVKGRGLVVRDWVEQRCILAHPAIGGFMTHCGWNSVAEGLSMGVPLLAWPMEAEQTLNAKYVEMGLKAGIMIPQELDEESKIIKTVRRGVICDGVKVLMTGEEGKNARAKAQEIGKMAREALLSPPPHVVIFPFMAQGHTIPLLDISKALASRGLKVTIITTPSNAPFILSNISAHPTVSLSILTFPKVPYLPEGCENIANLPSNHLLMPFVEATENLQKPFEDILRGMCNSSKSTPICVISDMFLYWTLEPCRLFDIPRLVSYGMGTLPMLIVRSVYCLLPNLGELSNPEAIELPNVSLPFPLINTDLPPPFWRGRDAVPRVISQLEQASGDSWGIVVNCFEELEHEYICPLESLFGKEIRAWLVGPLLLHGQGIEKQHSCLYMKWLDRQVEAGFVIYVSFGSQGHLSDKQMEEIAFGLEMAGQPFIWAIKSKTWTPPVGWEERVKGRGLVLRDWVEQRNILAHPAIGGFMTHCGWNSVIEGLSMGVPLLTWPMEAEQMLNAKYVANGLKAGIMIPQERDEEYEIKVIYRRAICDAVKQLMTGDQGKEARHKARDIGKMARKAVEKGGSSIKRLDELIECLLLRAEAAK